MSSDVEMALKPLEVKDDSFIEKYEPRSSEEKFGLMDERFVLDPNRITMLMKGDFKRCNHVTSGRYYLPETPMLSIEGRKCLKLSSLKTMANFYPCAASCQLCFSETPMIRLNSCNIDDFKPFKILYCDMSFLLINEGKPVGIKAPSEDTDEERRKLLTESNCIELLKPVNPCGDTVYFMDSLPVEVPLYGPDGVMFGKTRQTKTVSMMMRMYANSWENLEIDKLLTDQERKRNTSGSTSHSQEDPSTS